MKIIAIHQKNDWYLGKLRGFSEIPRKHIKVDVSLSADVVAEHGYKPLHGEAIMGRYFEKEGRRK